MYLFQAHLIYSEYGNTFGIGLGGDSKFPTWKQLLRVENYYDLTKLSLTWGLTWFGGLAGVFLLLVRRLDGYEWALILGNIVGLVVSMRYSSSASLGSHYHIFATLTGSWLVAHLLKLMLGTIKSRYAQRAVLALLRSRCWLLPRSTHLSVSITRRAMAAKTTSRSATDFALSFSPGTESL